MLGSLKKNIEEEFEASIEDAAISQMVEAFREYLRRKTPFLDRHEDAPISAEAANKHFETQLAQMADFTTSPHDVGEMETIVREELAALGGRAVPEYAHRVAEIFVGAAGKLLWAAAWIARSSGRREVTFRELEEACRTVYNCMLFLCPSRDDSAQDDSKLGRELA